MRPPEDPRIPLLQGGEYVNTGCSWKASSFNETAAENEDWSDLDLVMGDGLVALRVAGLRCADRSFKSPCPNQGLHRIVTEAEVLPLDGG